MKIGILGSGEVGQQLGKGFVQLGHEVKLGTRHPEKLENWLKEVGGKSSIDSFEDAAKFAEVAVIATRWIGTKEILDLAGKNNFNGKIVIDVTNPLDFSTGMPGYLGSVGKSSGEQIQKWLPKAKVVKAFNTINNKMMCNPKMKEGDPDLFIAGNEEGKEFVTNIAKKWGWKSVIDLGDISKSQMLEDLAMIWIEYGFKYNNRAHAFKLLKS